MLGRAKFFADNTVPKSTQFEVRDRKYRIICVALCVGALTIDALADGSITSDKFAAGAVDTGSIADGGVTSSKIGDEQILSRHLAGEV